MSKYNVSNPSSFGYASARCYPEGAANNVENQIRVTDLVFVDSFANKVSIDFITADGPSIHITLPAELILELARNI